MTESTTPDATWTVAQLREHARTLGVDLGGARTKAAILEVVLAEPSSVVAATERSIADGLSRGILDPLLHAGPMQAMRVLALKIDAYGEYMMALRADALEHGSRPPSQDNVSIPTYLKYSAALGLLPGKTVGEGRAPGARAKTPKVEDVPAEPVEADDVDGAAPVEPTPMPVGQARAEALSKLRSTHVGR